MKEGEGGGGGQHQQGRRLEGTKAKGTGGDEVDVLQGRYLPKVQKLHAMCYCQAHSQSGLF
jgi:hypothetical protein